MTKRGRHIAFWLCLALWLAIWIVLQLWAVSRRLGSFNWWAILFYPVPLLGFFAIFAFSVAKKIMRRDVKWKGRSIRLG